ncbi:helix-turn-helix domain-containing protein [Streptomyces sp. NPDC096132]|uniref:helix-turn-helix domain-containing protein n=1 Tax=Streptomyces sp. NPDC096132 TaxID=3366075 RepID=UPI003816C370
MAAEAGISRRCLAKWYARWRAHGENGLLDHSPSPSTSPPAHPRTSLTRWRCCGGRPSTGGPARRRPVAAARRHPRAGDRAPHHEQSREAIRYEHDRVDVDVWKLGRNPTGGARRPQARLHRGPRR